MTTPRQLAFVLKAPKRWGGAREGAGRKPSPRPRVRHRERAEFPARHPGLVTIRVRGDVPSLRTLRLLRELERSLRGLAVRADFRVVQYSVQHDHVHWLVESEGSTALSNGMKSLAARFARGVNRAFGRRGAVLDGRYHHRALATPREVRSALAYVLNNARHHAAQRSGDLIARPGAIDPASSGRWFEGWADPAPAPDGTPAVACARTWLLRAGWRRHGLIGRDEIPGRVPCSRRV